MEQTFSSERFGVITFIDKRQTYVSAKCQPRDLVITQGEDSPKVKEEIALDIRIGQGIDPIGAARGMKHD